MPKREDVRRINQRTGGAGGASVVLGTGGTSSSPTTLSAGADVRVSGTEIQRAGAGVLLFSGSGALLVEYSTITAALADAAAGDRVEAAAGTWTESFEVPADVLFEGMGAATIINGAVTLKGRIARCKIARSADTAAVVAGIVAGDVGDEGIVESDVIVDIANAGGPAYAVYMTTGGDITVLEGALLATTGTPGYAAYVHHGGFTHEHGRAVGTVPSYPYWVG